MKPLELANLLRAIVATHCGCGTEWRETPVTAHEFAGIYADVLVMLIDRREQAIAAEHGPLSEEEEFVGEE